MRVLIGYDVATADKEGQKRLRAVARACKDYGIRVQKSLFECNLGQKEWVALRQALLSCFDPEQDSLRFYFLDKDTNVEHLGQAKPVDVEQPLIL